jgi:hypothetical protein
MTCETEGVSRVARRRYVRDVAISGAIYMVLVFGAALAIRQLDLPQWAVIALSLAPVVPALMMLRAYIVFTRAMDEFQRRLQSEALIVASAVVVFSSFAYGFLEEWAEFPHISLLYVFPAFCGAWGFAHLLIRRRYK